MRRAKLRGHNLLEAIIAGMLFATVAVGLMGIWDMQFKAMLKSKETAVASFIAEKIMEECVAAGFEEAGNLYPVPENVQIRSRTKTGERLATYEIVVDVQPHPSDVAQRTVVVRVNYSDNSGDRSVQYHTVLNEHG